MNHPLALRGASSRFRCGALVRAVVLSKEMHKQAKIAAVRGMCSADSNVLPHCHRVWHAHRLAGILAWTQQARVRYYPVSAAGSV
jgi:hypothetical protein